MYQAGQLKQYSERCFIIIGSQPYGSSSNEFTAWSVPKEARFVSFYLVGSGGGGAAGASGTAGTTRVGGGGGGSGSVSTAIFQARCLPQTIYFRLMVGGQGGQTSGQSGGGGGQVAGTTSAYGASVISSFPNTIASSAIILSANSGIGATSNGGSGGAAITSSSYASRCLTFNSVAGNSGVNQNKPGSNYTSTICPTGGAGGAGTTTSTPFNGGNILTGDIVYTGGASNTTVMVQGGTAGGAVDGANGHDNVIHTMPIGSSMPLYMVGGGGGASTDNGQGGNGGKGGLGCGGGGGGSGVTGSHGVGGDGGAGFCIIEWW